MMTSSESSFPPNPRNDSEKDDAEVRDDLKKLRRLIVGPERAQLEQLQHQWSDPEWHARQISRVLPEAISLRNAQDQKIAQILEPTIEASLRTSIRRNRQSLVDAIFPVIGPAIRKAIAASIYGMIQSFNKALEHSVSLQGLKWRLEALRTKKTFGEVVMLHTLVYRVEQIFLIHRQTGLMLQHVVDPQVSGQDPDLVSSMLTAIEDFVHDSFNVEKGAGIDTLRIGDRSIWVEQGSQAVLAAVIQGTPPVHMRETLREVLEFVQIVKGDLLKDFDGDVTPFEDVRGQLEDCLQAQRVEAQRRTSPWLWVLFVLLVLAVGLAGGSWALERWRWNNYLERLRAEPGVIITAAEAGWRNFALRGLRDPLAADPVKLLDATGLDLERVQFYWEPYHALWPDFILQRAHQLLQPPSTVALTLEQGVLQAKGRAEHRWILAAQQLGPAVPGVARFQSGALINIDWETMQTLQQNLQQQRLYFDRGAPRLGDDQQTPLREIAALCHKVLQQARRLDLRVHIKIVGHADSSGVESGNLKLSQARADGIRAALIEQGIIADRLVAIGVGSKRPWRDELTEQDRGLNRRINFEVLGAFPP
jgi:OOP family OmpA-OmpF porin